MKKAKIDKKLSRLVTDILDCLPQKEIDFAYTIGRLSGIFEFGAKYGEVYLEPLEELLKKLKE